MLPVTMVYILLSFGTKNILVRTKETLFLAAHSLVLFEKIERESRREVAVVLTILGV